MKVFLTGPDGLLGSNLVRLLLAEGHAVKALVYPGSQSKTIDDLPIEKVSGDILDYESLLVAMNGCEAVIHAAANTSVWPTKSPKIWDINVKGTQHAIDAVVELGIKRMVHVSSASSFTHGSLDQPGDETAPFGGDQYGLDYIESKYAGQQIVQRAVAERGLPAVIINPTYMIGAFDSLPSSGKLLVNLAKKKLPGYTSGGKNFVYVKDVAQAIINALTMGRVGECYIAGNVNHSYQEIFHIMAKVAQVSPPKLAVPDALMQIIGRISTGWGKLARKDSPMNHATAKFACESQYYSPQKAVQELKMPQTPIEAAIQEAYDWFVENEYI
ncbi:MAG TPA: NAD-dependent epimerase/dehydratase family protein [Saprospiraceae bacterium]|nr:NAD-dependent epimerase/dehydratase family protein [Saprospiraceae bacterium]